MKCQTMLRRSRRVASVGVFNLIFSLFLSSIISSHPSRSEGVDTGNITLENRSVQEAVEILSEIAGVTIELEGPVPDYKLNKVFSNRSLEESLSRILQPLDYVIIWRIDGVVTVIVGQSLSSIKQNDADAIGISEPNPANFDYEPSLSESELVPPSESDPAVVVHDAPNTAAIRNEEAFGNFDIVPPDDESQPAAPAAGSILKDDDSEPVPSLSEDELVPYTEAPLFDDRASAAEVTDDVDPDTDLVPPD